MRISIYSFIGSYLIMPETENRTLEEIEHFFSDRTIKLFDIRIRELPEKAEGDVKVTEKHVESNMIVVGPKEFVF